MKLNNVFKVFLSLCLVVFMTFSEMSFAKGGSSFSSSSASRSSSLSSSRSGSSSQSRSNVFSSGNSNNYASRAAITSTPTSITRSSKPVIVSRSSSTVSKPVTVVSRDNFTVIGKPQTVSAVKTVDPVKVVVNNNRDNYYNRNIDNGYSVPIVTPIYVPSSSTTIVSGNYNGVSPVVIQSPPKMKAIEVPKLKMEFIPEKYCKNWMCSIK